MRPRSSASKNEEDGELRTKARLFNHHERREDVFVLGTNMGFRLVGIRGLDQ